MTERNGIPTNAPARAASAGGGEARFWYWFGASGRRYIHSVYDLASAPLLPGAVYVAARPDGGDGREALACGILPPPGGDGEAVLEALRRAGAQEVHLHVLAASPGAARRICRDIRSHLGVGAPDLPEGGGAEEGGEESGAERGLAEPAAPLLEPLLEKVFSAGRSWALRCPGLPR